MDTNTDYDILCLVSGPEPQRTIFEQKTLEQLFHIDEKSLLLRGLPGAAHSQQLGPVTIKNHMESTKLQAILAGATNVVSRAGYSTVMDLIQLNKTALLVPTPGQPEQEYLAKLLQSRKWFCFQSQKRLDIVTGIEALQQCSPPNLNPQQHGLNEAVESFLNNVSYEPASASQIGANSSRTPSP